MMSFLSNNTSIANVFGTSSSPVSMVRETIETQAEVSRSLFALARDLSQLADQVPAEHKAQVFTALKKVVENGEKLVQLTEKMSKSL